MDMRKWAREARISGVEFFNAKAVRALKDVDFSINEKSAVKHQIAGKVKDGEIGIVWEGMDCDCCAFQYSTVVKASLMNLKRIIESNYEYAEGPLNYYFVKPDYARSVKHTSRDLALEAFEDGHPHVVYY